MALGGTFAVAGRTALEEMAQDFISRYISPGGCADLLAVMHFAYSVEKVQAMKY